MSCGGTQMHLCQAPTHLVPAFTRRRVLERARVGQRRVRVCKRHVQEEAHALTRPSARMVCYNADRTLGILGVETDHVCRLLHDAAVAVTTRAIGRAVKCGEADVHLSIRRGIVAVCSRAEWRAGRLAAVHTIVGRLTALRRVIEAAHVAAIRQPQPAFEASEGWIVAGVVA